MNKRDPELSSTKDGYTLMYIRRANLDACWSRATKTVTSNLNRIIMDTQSAEFSLELHDYLPELGWPKLEDRVGMGIALVTLNASLRPGKYAQHPWYRNAYESGSNYMVDTLYAQDEKKVHATNCVVSGEWFVRFKLGSKLRMGQIRKQDEAFTPAIIHALDKVAQDTWESSKDEDEKKKVEEMMPFVLMEFCACLRGEEVPLLSLQGLTTFWEETTTARDPFIMLTLRGRFKGEGELRWHCIPIPCNTRTGLPVLKWIRRMLRRLVVDEQRTTGWVFADANVNAGSWATTMLCLLIC